MADIDSIIAGVSGNTRADFANFDPVKGFFDANKQRADFDLRRAFKPTGDNPNGIPMQNGQADIPAMAKTFFQKGDFATGMTLLNQAAAQQERAGYVNGGVANSDLVSPSSARQASTPDIAPRNQGGQTSQVAPQGGQGGGQPKTVMELAMSKGMNNYDAGRLSEKLKGSNGIGPNGEIDFSNQQARDLVTSALRYELKNNAQPDQSNAPMAPQGQPQAQPQLAQQQAPTQAIQPQAAAPQPMQQAAPPPPDFSSRFGAAYQGQLDPATERRLRVNETSLDPGIKAAAKAERDFLYKNRELTTEQKNARDKTVEQYQQGQSELATEQALNTERGKGDIAEQRAYIDNAKMARPRLQTLNTISNILSSSKNLDLGPGSETTLKLKMALEKVGMDFGDLSGAQLMQKLGTVLASESTKALSTRPTQFEFKQFLSINPGLSLDEKGNVRLIGIMSQVAKRDVELGALARRTAEQGNWSKWDDVVEAYDKKFPIKDPTTGKELSNNSIIAPGPQPGPQPTQQAAPPAAYPNAKKAPDGNWYIPDPQRGPNKYLRVNL